MTTKSVIRSSYIFFFLLGFYSGIAKCQDTRTVTEPIMPGTPGGKTICAQFKATKYLAITTAVNIDPFNPTSTFGSTSFGACSSAGYGSLGCYGGTSIEPSATPAYSSGETTDNTSLNSVLASCPSGQVVEIVPDYSFTPPKYGIVLSPVTIPNGIGILPDPGIQVNASRNPTDYGGGNCGKIPTGSSPYSCGSHWILASQPSSNGIGIYGYGMFNARVWDRFINNNSCPTLSFCGFGYNRIQSYGNNHGVCNLSKNGSPNCTPVSGASGIAYGPDLLHFKGSSNFTTYKTIFKDSGNFGLYWGDNASGWTDWGTAVIAPFNMSNSDGKDPSYKATKWTITGRSGTTPGGDSIITNGDNQVACKSDSGAKYTAGITSNGTIDTVQTGAGIGVYCGTDISGGIEDIYITNLIQKGNTNNGQQEEGVGIDGNSDTATAGVNNFVVNGVCQQNLNKANYFVNNGTFAFTGINVSNDNYIGNYGTEFEYQGQSSSALLNLTLNNITNASSTTGSYEYLKVGGTNVSFNSRISGTGVTNTITNPGGNTPFPCNSSTWKPLRGELTMRTGTGIGQTNLYTYSTVYPLTSTYYIQAIVTPNYDWPSTKEDLTLTQPIILKDNGTQIATGTFVTGSNGTLVEFPISSATAGTHLYTAEYKNDSNYPGVDYTWGALAVTITGAPPPPTPTGVFSIQGQQIIINGTQITIKQQ